MTRYFYDKAVGTLKKLRKQSRILEYRVRILEDLQRIRELEQQQKKDAIGFQQKKVSNHG